MRVRLNKSVLNKQDTIKLILGDAGVTRDHHQVGFPEKNVVEVTGQRMDVIGPMVVMWLETQGYDPKEIG